MLLWSEPTKDKVHFDIGEGKKNTEQFQTGLCCICQDKLVLDLFNISKYTWYNIWSRAAQRQKENLCSALQTLGAPRSSILIF